MFRSLLGRPRTVRVPIDKSNVDVQQVKVTRQSRPVVARFILTCIVTTAVIQGVKRWDPLGTYAQRDVLSEELERVKRDAQHEHGDKYGKQWDKQHAQLKGSQATVVPPDSVRSDAIRLTIPVWLRKGHQRLYKESDPEWKEFVKLQNDQKRVEQLKRQVGGSVITQVKDHGRNKFELAVIKFNGRVSVALEVVPQVFTPPIYEVPCLWVSTTSINAGWRPLPPQTGPRMERVFRPVVLLEASAAAARVFFYVTYAVTKARILEAMGREKHSGRKSTVIIPQLPPPPQTSKNGTSLEDTKSAKPIFPFFPDLGNGDTMRKMHADVVSSMPYSSAIKHAAFAFNHARLARQKAAVSTNVRGVCQLRGYVTFMGDRGKFRLEIIAHYLPAEEVFIGSVNVKSSYIIQDYRGWDKLQRQNREELQRREEQRKKEHGDQQAGLNKPADKTTVSAPAQQDQTGDDKEKNK